MRLRAGLALGCLGWTTLAIAAPPPKSAGVRSGQAPLSRIHPRDGAELVTIPAGEYLAANQLRASPGKGTLPAFTIYRNLVTVAQYLRFCDATDRKLPAQPEWKERDGVNSLFPERWFRGESFAPVMNVTWSDAAAYARWVGGTLTTDAQWEKAAWGTVGPERGFESPYGVRDLRVVARQWCEFNADDRTSPQAQRLLKPEADLHSVRGAYGPFDPNPWEHSSITRGTNGHAFRCVVPMPSPSSSRSR